MRNPKAHLVWQLRKADPLMSHKDIAAKLGISEASAKHALYSRTDRPKDVPIEHYRLSPKPKKKPEAPAHEGKWGKHVAPPELWRTDLLEKKIRKMFKNVGIKFK